MLLYKQRKIQIQKKEEAGQELSNFEKQNKDEQRQKKRALDKRKSVILSEFIFPGLANLTVFLEYARSQELREEFDKDLQALFLATSSIPPQNKDTVFERFMSSLLSVSEEKSVIVNNKKGGRMQFTDFRFILYDMIQKEIWKMIIWAAPLKFDEASFCNSVVYPDIGRAVSWMALLATEAYSKGLNFDRNGRPVKF